MSNEKFIDYKSNFFNYEREEVKGLHIMRGHSGPVMIGQRVTSKEASKTKPFYLPNEPKDLRKIAKILVEIAKEIEGK